MHSVLFSIKLGHLEQARPAQPIGQMQGGAACAWGLHRRSTSERDLTLHGSVRSDGAQCFQDEASEKKIMPGLGNSGAL
jgi:hypothetical protein